MSLRDLVTGRLLVAETTREGDRVTNLELFFDLVFVFAFTQVTGLMAEGEASGHGALAVVQGLGVLGTIWWAWTSFAWLANQARADRGVVRIGIVAATILMFLVSLAVPESFSHAPGALFAPLVFAVGITLVSLVHGTIYTIAAGEDAGLKRQVVRSLGFVNLPVVPLLVVGAFVGGPVKAWLWLAAPVVEFLVINATSRGGEWRLKSLSHFVERHGLVVMLALGESVVAIGTGVLRARGGAQLPLDWPILAGASISIVLTLALWWCYFAHLAGRTEHALGSRPAPGRVTPITDTFTYLHLPLIAGIIIAALGIETAMHQVDAARPLGLFGAAALCSGVSLYLAATGFVWLRVSGQWSLVRFAAAAACLAVIPATAALPAFVGLAMVAALVVALAVVENVLGPRGRLRLRIDPRPADPAVA